MTDFDAQQLGRIEQSIIDMKEDVTEVKSDVKEGFALMNGRVRKLENWRNVILGAFLVTHAIAVILLKIYL